MINLGSQSLPYSRTSNDIYGTYYLNFIGYNKTCTVSLIDPNATTTPAPTTTTTTAAPGTTGFIVSSTDYDENPTDYSGTYCEDGTYNGKPKYRKAGTSYYINYIENYWVVSGGGPSDYLGDSFANSTAATPPTSGWFDYLYNKTISVTVTTCSGTTTTTTVAPTTTTTTTTAAPSTPAYLVTGASDSSYNGTYALAGTTIYGGVTSNYYRITGQSRYLYWTQAYGYQVWMISDTLGLDFYGEFNGYTSGGESDSVPVGDSGFWSSYGSITGAGPTLTSTIV